jgi:alpha-L-fucosidase
LASTVPAATGAPPNNASAADADKSTVAGWTLGLVAALAAGARAGQQGELPVAEGPFRPTMQSLAQYRCPQWFRDAKFGIWAHWGPQAVPMDGDGYAHDIYREPCPPS